MKLILLITVDTLRADHCGFHGYRRNTTPFLDQLAQENVFFRNAYSNGPLTVRSFPSILCSTYQASNKGDITDYNLPAEAKTAAEYLREMGYYTVAFQAGNPFISRYYGFDRGFDEFHDYLFDDREPQSSPVSKVKKLLRPLKIIRNLYSRVKKLSFIGYYLRVLKGSEPFVRAEKINRDLLNWFDKNDKEKVFMWVHYMDVHQPHFYHPRVGEILGINPVSKFREALIWTDINSHDPVPEKRLKTMQDLYDVEVRRLDDEIGSLFKELGDRGLLEDSLFIVTSDHGDEFGEHGGVGHLLKLYNEMLHVPLILADGERSGCVDNTVDLACILPTVLHYLGVEAHDLAGESLTEFIDSDRERTVVSESIEKDPTPHEIISAIKDGVKLIHYFSGSGDELYDLRRDPGEQKNLVGDPEYVGREREILSLIQEHVKSRNPPEKNRVKDALADMKL